MTLVQIGLRWALSSEPQLLRASRLARIMFFARAVRLRNSNSGVGPSTECVRLANPTPAPRSNSVNLNAIVATVSSPPGPKLAESAGTRALWRQSAKPSKVCVHIDATVCHQTANWRPVRLHSTTTIADSPTLPSCVCSDRVTRGGSRCVDCVVRGHKRAGMGQ